MPQKIDWVKREFYNNDTFLGLAAAYPGENIDGFLADPWVQQAKAPVFADLATLLKQTQPDVLVVSTRPDQRSPCQHPARLEAGLPVWLEKPPVPRGNHSTHYRH
jgi:predicted dehydrogenase